MLKVKSRINVVVILLLGIAVFIGSCSKETSFDANENNNKKINFRKVSDYSLDNIPLVRNMQKIENLLVNPEDKDDEKINNYLYELSVATREFIKDANFNSIIIELAKKSANSSANLLDLEDVAPQYYAAINNSLSGKGLSLRSISDDLTHKPIATNPNFPESSKIENYVPSIFIPNLSNVDVRKQPIISPNIEVDCRNDKSLEDNIIAWYYTESEDLKEILISEEISLRTTNPLFLLDNASLDVKKNEMTIHPPEENIKSTTAFSSHEYSINYGYESWAGGDSEFYVYAIRITPSGDVVWIYNSSVRKRIAKVDRDDIGKSLTKWSRHSENYTPYSQNYVYWNTYERDWNRSLKTLGVVNENGSGNCYMAGKRKYTSEWYAWDPDTIGVHNTNFSYIYSHWARWYNSWKSTFRIWRVQV